MSFIDENGQAPKGFNFTNNELKAINTLHGIIYGITSDGVINDHEINFLRIWLLDNEIYSSKFPINAVKRRIEEILSDGIISEDERIDLYQLLSTIIGGTFQETGACIELSTSYGVDLVDNIAFDGSLFCLTGAFATGTRNQVEAIIESKRGIPSTSVTKKTNYLVIGALASRDWITSSHGRKIEKAMLFKENGSNILIITEENWLKLI